MTATPSDQAAVLNKLSSDSGFDLTPTTSLFYGGCSDQFPRWHLPETNGRIPSFGYLWSLSPMVAKYHSLISYRDFMRRRARMSDMYNPEQDNEPWVFTLSLGELLDKGYGLEWLNSYDHRKHLEHRLLVQPSRVVNFADFNINRCHYAPPKELGDDVLSMIDAVVRKDFRHKSFKPIDQSRKFQAIGAVMKEGLHVP